MPRISGAGSNQAPWHLRLIYWFRKRKYGNVPQATKSLAHDPRLLRQYVRMSKYSETKGAFAAESDVPSDAEDCNACWLPFLN